MHFASVLLNGPPRDGPVGFLLGQVVRTTNNYSVDEGIPHATNKVDQALPSKESLRESSIPREFKPLR